ncbi:BTAD domain-containing putative transcriptional regulator [Streptosporangium sp. NPDC048047]|uniref:ATP-binding protein n=1 Tax=Streptosporangium sp. NPDC048047 TaxID=3155748 RepID=UPI0034405133
MPIHLTLLDGVRWQGRPVVGERAQALLAALALDCRTVSADRLVAEVWGDGEPANPAKALQVLVSRTRSVMGPASLVTEGTGYRLGVPSDRIDAGRLHALAGRAEALLAGNPAAAAAAAEEALALGAGALPSEGGGPLAEVRRRAEHDLASARVVLARARSRSGDHGPALPGLEEAVRVRPEDEGLLADLLHSEAAVRGTGAALDRFERYRSDLRDRIGADVGPELRRVHRELLALDSPVRAGVRFDATPLLGRDEDLRRVRALLAASRVVSVLGPGGLGKTRLAHAVAREAPQPVVHFVELVGVTAPEDLVGEVGSALGVRDSVAGRRTLSPRQRADVRARIAQQLDLAPALLVLDNCEHLVEAVADLVSYLAATTRELRVLTTTRSPLAIAAERVYPLPQLGTGDAARLFRDRATAARPGVRLDTGDVHAVVARLDGLPLAIELAAAKVRVMSPAEIARRLEDRFTLLRGGDRSAPSRHQTLLAVIDWSWNLLGERERRALRRLSAFPDGFALDAAEEVLGCDAPGDVPGGPLGDASGDPLGDALGDALGDVEELVEQSLLTVVETADGVRYRMLETVREFGRMRLDAAGETAGARAAVRAWAVGYAGRHGVRLYSPEQVDAMDRLRPEETNLADVLREALTEPDPEAVTVLFSALSGYWTIRGDHPRSIVLSPAVAAALDGWTPPPRLLDPARMALSMALFSTVMAASEESATSFRSLSELGADSANPAVRALVTALLAMVSDPEHGLDELAAGPDPLTRQIALHWLSHGRENAGDPAGAIEAARAALELVGDDGGPWPRALLNTQLASLHAHLGDSAAAAGHAAEAIPVLERLGAVEDAVQLRAALAMTVLAEGRRDEAARMIDDLEALASRGAYQGAYQGTYGDTLSVAAARAELALADGDVAEGLRRHRETAETLRNLRIPGAPGGFPPWVVLGEVVALSALAQYGEGDDGADLFASLRSEILVAFGPDRAFPDLPVIGMALAGLGLWGLLKGAMPTEEAVRMLVLADRFAYSRFTPTMRWAALSAHAERVAPGVLSRIDAEYGERRGPDLLAEARAALERLV